MITKYPLLTSEECQQIVADLSLLEWNPGIAPSKTYAEKVKGNKEIAFGQEKTPELAKQHFRMLAKKVFECKFFSRRFFPKHMANPRFNLYEDGGYYGKHADSAFMGSEPQVRTDASMTIFLTEPDSYEGGELELEYASGMTHLVKEPAGTMLSYPSGVMHQVHPVTSGRRMAFVCWFESHIQNPQMREVLIEISNLCDGFEDYDELRHGDLHTKAVNVKHNLFRMWWKNQE